MTRKKKYSKEFKLDAVNLVLEQNYTKAAAARSLEVNPNLLGRWVVSDHFGTSFPMLFQA